MSPVASTARGHRWVCNLCPHRPTSIRDACEHAIANPNHLLFEVAGDVDISKWTGWASRARRYIRAEAGQALVEDGGVAEVAS